MKTYKDTDDNLFAYELDGSQDYLISSNLIQITDEEAEAIRLSKIIPPAYQELRIAEYPPISDYIDGIVKGDLVQQQNYIDACLAVKAKYPKV
jgi:hypothetical protein